MCQLNSNGKVWPIATFVLYRYHGSPVGIHLCSIPQEPCRVGAIYLATCFVMFNMYGAQCRKCSEEKHCTWYQHFYRRGPLVCHNAALKEKAIRVACSNGWHMCKLASLRSVFNLTQFQSMLSNRWASLRDYTWPPGQPRPLPQTAGIQIAAEWSGLSKWVFASLPQCMWQWAIDGLQQQHNMLKTLTEVT